MPYLRVTCPELEAEQRCAIATRLTDEIIELFFNPRSPVTREQLRERTTVHFIPYAENELFVGGRTPTARGRQDITVELSDWEMSARKQRKVASALTPVIAELFHVPSQRIDGVNIRFHPFPATDFAVGGRLLADFIPFVGRMAKRLFD